MREIKIGLPRPAMTDKRTDKTKPGIVRFRAGSVDRSSGKIDPLRHSVERLRTGMFDEVGFKRTVRDVLAKHGNGAIKISEVQPDAAPAVTDALRKALPYHLATFGPVLPVRARTKVPAVKAWQKSATTDHVIIDKMVAKYPDCNWGISWNIIDPDNKTKIPGTPTGVENWAKLTAEHGEPDTRQAETPTGGLHVYVNDALAKSSTIPNIDVKRAGLGQCLAPGSYVVANGDDIRATGFYKWRNNKPVASVPWIAKTFGGNATAEPVERGVAAIVELDTEDNIERAVERLKGYASSPVERSKNGKQVNGPAIEGDHGDEWTVQVAMNVGDLGISREMCLQLMADHFDPACVPQWGERLSEKVNSAYNSRETPPGSNTAEADFAHDPIDEAEEKERAEKRKARFAGHSLSTLMQRPDVQWYVPGLFGPGLIVFYAKPKRGKTFVALDLSLSIATGVYFHGIPIGKTGRVLYVAAEGGGKSIAKRVMRMIKKRGLTKEQAALAEKNLRIVEWGVHLNDPRQVKEFLAANPGKWQYAVFDTWARNMKGDENSVKDASPAVVGIDYIREKTGADALVLHHEGRAGGHMRGSSALDGAADGIIRGSRDAAGVIQIKAEALREDAEGTTMQFRLTDGVLVPVKARNVLRDREEKMINALVALHTAAKAPIAVKDWKKAVENLGGILDGEKEAKRKQWTRAVEYMEKTNAISLTGKVSGHSDNRFATPLASSTITDDYDDAGENPADDFKDDN